MNSLKTHTFRNKTFDYKEIVTDVSGAVPAGRVISNPEPLPFPIPLDCEAARGFLIRLGLRDLVVPDRTLEEEELDEAAGTVALSGIVGQLSAVDSPVVSLTTEQRDENFDLSVGPKSRGTGLEQMPSGERSGL